MQQKSHIITVLLVLLTLSLIFIALSSQYELNFLPGGTTFLRDKQTNNGKFIYVNPQDKAPLQVEDTQIDPVRDFGDGTTALTTYVSNNAQLTLSFKQPMYVKESSQQQGNELGSLENGKITISTTPFSEDQSSRLDIDYVIPFSGVSDWYQCNYNDATIHSVIKTIAGKETAVCEQNLYLYTDYIQNPSMALGYKFGIVAKTIDEYQLYQDILYSGIAFTK